MQNSSARVASPPELRQLQIIVLALAGGVAMFAAVAAFVRGNVALHVPAETGQLVMFVAVGMAVMTAPAYFAVRAKSVARVAADRDAALELVRADKVPPPLQHLTIVAAALAEAVGIAGSLAILLGAPDWVFVVPAAAVVCIVLGFPTSGRLENLVRGSAE